MFSVCLLTHFFVTVLFAAVAMLSFCISYLNRLKNGFSCRNQKGNRTTFILLDCSHGEDVNVDGNIRPNELLEEAGQLFLSGG